MSFSLAVPFATDWIVPPKIAPLAPLLIPAPFNDDDFTFALKYDGFRCIAYFEDGTVRLETAQAHAIEKEKKTVFPFRRHHPFLLTLVVCL